MAALVGGLSETYGTAMTRRASYPTAATWGNEASGVLRALQSVVAHDRLDAEFESEQDQVAAADELLTP